MISEVILCIKQGISLKEKVSGQDKNYAGATCLFFAAEQSNHAILQLLLETSLVKVDEQDYRGQTAIFYAVRKGNLGGVRELVAAGASLLVRD
mgnify:CR=1 FL=1